MLRAVENEINMSGYFDAIIYVVLSSLAFVFLDKLCNEINPLVAIFAMSGVAIICFNLLAIRQFSHTYRMCLTHKGLFLLMSGSLALDWISQIYATHLSDPFVAMAAIFIASGFMGFAELYYKTRQKVNLISMLLLLVGLGLLFFSYQIRDSRHVGYGVILGIITGVCFYIYIVTSNLLVKKGALSSLQLLATRFWLLFFATIPFLPWNILLTEMWNNLWLLLFVSVCSMVVPIYFVQQAITKLGSARAAIYISFVPPVTYLFYVLYNHNLSLANLLVCLVVSAALLLPRLITTMLD
jgi:drug/metabolite transporter (DMT)-like permease